MRGFPSGEGSLSALATTSSPLSSRLFWPPFGLAARRLVRLSSRRPCQRPSWPHCAFFAAASSSRSPSSPRAFSCGSRLGGAALFVDQPMASSSVTIPRRFMDFGMVALTLPSSHRRRSGLAHRDRAAGGVFAEHAAGVGAAARCLRGDERERLFQRHRVRALVLGQRGVDLAPVDIGAEAAGLARVTAPPFGCSPSTRPDARRRSAAAAAALSLATMRSMARLPPISSTSSSRVEVRIGLAVLDVGPVAPDAGEDRLAGGRDAWRPRAAATAARAPSRASTSAGFMPLGSDERFGFSPSPSCDVGAEAAVAQRHLEAGFGIVAEQLHARAVAVALAGRRRSAARQRAGELAFGIVRAADEGAELAELERQPARRRRPGRRAGRSRPPWRGKMCGPSSSLRLSSTSVVRRSLVSPIAAEKSRQKSRSTCLPVDLVRWRRGRASPRARR